MQSKKARVATNGRAASSNVALDLYPFIRKYNDGCVVRFLTSTFVPASEDGGAGAARGVATRDVAIDRDNGVSARLFLPSGAAAAAGRRRLPIVLYFHGGCFCTESAFCRTYHRYAASLASRAGALVVSVEYRLAPEHPIPAAYDDAWAAFRAGGNIAYHTVARASRENDDDDIQGLIMVQPFFWGAERLPSETVWDDGVSAFPPYKVDELWPFVTAGQAGNDDHRIDPADHEITSLSCRRVLMAVAGMDTLRDRGCRLAARMRGGADVTVVESEGEDHGFHLYSPLRATSRRLMESIVQFINQPSHSPAPLRWPATILSELHDTTDSPQILLPMPTRKYKAVFIDRFEKRTKTGASSATSTAVNASLAIGRGKLATKKSYGLLFGQTRAYIYVGLAAGSLQ
uniref:Alpha/beta hydrolase fold-3 domain-containing protein n=1 Tax=Oryza glumipatula TaxID=40148 RepID=A0A0E0AKR8_9ORYZ